MARPMPLFAPVTIGYFSLEPAEPLPQSWVFCVCHSYCLLIFQGTLAQLGRKFQAEDGGSRIED